MNVQSEKGRGTEGGPFLRVECYVSVIVEFEGFGSTFDHFGRGERKKNRPWSSFRQSRDARGSRELHFQRVLPARMPASSLS